MEPRKSRAMPSPRESNPIAYTLSVTTPDEVVAVVNNPEIKPHARPTYELTRNVFFVGFMVAGKTSTSRRLARQCGLATIDLDAYIERRERRAINQIFAEQGEQAFRDIIKPRCSWVRPQRPHARFVRRRRRAARGRTARF